MSETIQVPGGTQEEYVRQAQARKDQGIDRISLILRWTAGIILFIAVIIAAIIRGISAYNTPPNIQTNFVPRNSINFPVITLCPMRNFAISIVECVKETNLKLDADCVPTIYNTMYEYYGFTANCIVVNDPKDGSAPFASSSFGDLLEIEISINSSSVIPGEPIGVYGVVHQQKTLPDVEVDSTFVGIPGQWTEVWALYNEVNPFYGGQYIDYEASAYSTIIQEDLINDYASIISISLSFPNQGAFVSEEYYVYSANNWVGEIGGLAFLLYMLHWIFCLAIISLLSKLKQKGYVFKWVNVIIVS